MYSIISFFKVCTAVLLYILIFPSYSLGQSFYDSGNMDWSTGLQYDSTNQNYFFHSYQSTGILDTMIVRNRVNLDSNLQISSTQIFNPILFGLGENGSIIPLDGVSNGFINVYIDHSNSYNGYFARKYEIARYSDSSITQQIPIGPDSAVFNASINLQKRVGNTVHILFSYLQTNVLDTFGVQLYIKYDINSGSMLTDTLPQLMTSTRYISDTLPAHIGLDAVKLPNNDWLILGLLERPQALHFYAFQTSPNFLQIKNSWPVNYGLGSEKKLFRRGNQIYLLNSSYRNYQGQPRQDYSIETFDYTQDTLVTRYFFDLRDSTGYLDDFFSTAYFDGKHFVFAGTSDYLPSLANYKYSLELFTVDLSFNIINRFSYTDSSASFDGFLGSLLPHPADSNKLIYSGYVIEPTRNASADLIWGGYNILNNVSLPEGPIFRKARIHLFPNPSSGEVQLLYTSEDFKPYEIEIYNMEGKAVYKTIVNAARQSLNLNLASGAYTLYHKAGEHYEYHRLIIE